MAPICGENGNFLSYWNQVNDAKDVIVIQSVYLLN